MPRPFARPALRIPRPGPALRSLLALLATRRRQYLLGMLALCVSDGGQLAIARVVGRTVDALREGVLDAGGLQRRALAIVGIAVTIMGARYA